jgi:polyhydroxyalkanoate synthesis repressor PhaR
MAKRIIKKYPNRRLYDTEVSSYITIEDLRQLVIDNEDFEVHDAKSGADLTRLILLQIISEREEQGAPMLSTALLSKLIRFYGDSLQGFMGNYLERSLEVFMDQQGQFRQQLNSMLGQTPWSMMQGLAERNMDMMKNLQRSFINAATGVRRPENPTPTPTPAANSAQTGETAAVNPKARRTGTSRNG